MKSSAVGLPGAAATNGRAEAAGHFYTAPRGAKLLLRAASTAR
jgi:hypothetical protein